DADDPGAGHHHGPRHLVEQEDAVGVHDRLLVELDGAGPGRLGSGGDAEVLGRDLARVAVAAGHLDGGRAGELGRAGDDGDPVAGELAADGVVLAADHVPGAPGQVGDGDVVLDPVALPVHLALVQAGEVEHGLAQGLGRDRAGVQAHATEHLGALDDRDPFVELGGGDGRLLAAGTGTYDQQVEIVHGTSVPVRPRPAVAQSVLVG